MAGVIFSQKSIFHLNKLSNAVYRKSAKRFRLKDKDGVRDLIHFAGGLQDRSVNTFVAQFMDSLSLAERHVLMANDVVAPGIPLGSDKVPGWYAQAV
ncbi:hypothetical protein NBRC116494_34760 [Aurantivibrio plasticivorans]